MLEILRPLTIEERIWRSAIGIALCVLSMAISVAIGNPEGPDVVLQIILLILGLQLFFMWGMGCLLTASGLVGYTLK